MNSKDLRVVRTQKLLEDALLKLIEQKPYEKITIKDISDTAMINRNTFYLHYTDKDALLHEIIRKHLQKIKRTLPPPDTAFDVQQGTADLLLAIQEDMHFYQLMLKCSTASDISNRMTMVFREQFMRGLKRDYASQAERNNNFSMLMQYTLSGVIGVIFMWIESDGQYTLQEVTNFIRIISNQRISEVL